MEQALFCPTSGHVGKKWNNFRRQSNENGCSWVFPFSMLICCCCKIFTAPTGETSRVTGDLVLQKAESTPKIPQLLPLLLILCDSRAWGSWQIRDNFIWFYANSLVCKHRDAAICTSCRYQLLRSAILFKVVGFLYHSFEKIVMHTKIFCLIFLLFPGAF